MNYLTYVVTKMLADVSSRVSPGKSVGIRRRVVEARPQFVDEKVRLVDTLSKLHIDASNERAELASQAALMLFRYLPGNNEFDPTLAAFLGQVLQLLADPATPSSAQNFQDYWVLFETGRKHGGYFVEFGAADGLELSNTFLLESKFGWQGLLAEPNPENHASLHRNRGCAISEACVWSQSGEQLEFVQDGYLSTIAAFEHGDHHRRQATGRVMVETISLLDLLLKFDAPRQIDFLSIDTEGSEFQILSNFDFSRFDIACIAVEHNFGPQRADIFNLLTRNGFTRRFEALSRWDDWYVKVRSRGA